ncbi:DMT family transporter [Paenibacillus gyeongsangnamensis]|uniref:DMT family transporter n=1 Tax=Paenibacillus gyeongsangnamensis TaxID=3388067 RepID=UPI002FD3B6BA
MKISGGFAKLWPSILMFVFYGSSFTLLNLALKHIEVSVAYATWSGNRHGFDCAGRVLLFPRTV